MELHVIPRSPVQPFQVLSPVEPVVLAEVQEYPVSVYDYACSQFTSSLFITVSAVCIAGSVLILSTGSIPSPKSSSTVFRTERDAILVSFVTVIFILIHLNCFWVKFFTINFYDYLTLE
jgi:hypothetical protein